jgi:hypothetical protein
MGEWFPSHCDCRMELGDDGEPTDFIRRCAQHQNSSPSDVIAENRALSLARMAIAQATDTPIEEVGAAIVRGKAHAEGPNGEVADFDPVSLDEYLSLHPNVVSFVTKRG